MHSTSIKLPPALSTPNTAGKKLSYYTAVIENQTKHQGTQAHSCSITRVTNSSQFVWELPSFSTESLTSQEMPLSWYKLTSCLLGAPLVLGKWNDSSPTLYPSLYTCSLFGPQLGRKDALMSSITHREDDAGGAKEGPYKSFVCVEPASKREMERDRRLR